MSLKIKEICFNSSHLITMSDWERLVFVKNDRFQLGSNGESKV